jgi:hypothetical protein
MRLRQIALLGALLLVGTAASIHARPDQGVNAGGLTFNKFNPDPNQTIHWGDQNWDEMQNCFVGVLIDPKIDAAKLFSPSGPSLLPRGASGPTLSALK